MSATNLSIQPTEPVSSASPAGSVDETETSHIQKTNLSPSSSYSPVSDHLKNNDSTVEQRVQQQVQQHQLFLHRQNSLRLSQYIKKKNDFESKINRL
jgi:hypothetical protein